VNTKVPDQVLGRSLLRPVVGLWLVVASFAAVTLVRSWRLGIPLRDPGGAVLRNRLLLSAGVFLVLVLLDVLRRTESSRRRRPSALLETARTRWTGARLVLAVSALLAYHLVYFCYHNLKSWDAFNRPRDQLLLGWDRWLFLGHDPSVVLHHLLGQHIATYALVGVYESFSTLVSVSFVAAVVLPDRMRDAYAFIASFIFVWILGVATYYAIPSLGPFHSAPADFAQLPHTMVQDTQARYMAQRAHMLADPQAPGSFAQVSAFASLHVGVTTVIVLMTRHLRLRRTARALAVFLVCTVVATVYLGWHFFVDDVAGIAIATVSVAAGLRMTGYRLFRDLHGQAPSRHQAGAGTTVHATTPEAR
jgi:hypothetical protein